MNPSQILLRELGIHATYKGYHFLMMALEMALENEKHLSNYSKTIFPTVARNYQSTPARIERDIRTVIEHCWNCSGREKLLEIAPYPLYKHPTVSEFIDITYWYLRFFYDQTTP